MPKVLIIECLDRTDPGSEGQFLTHMLNIMKVSSQYVQLQTKQQVLALLSAVPKSVEIIHFTTHGSIDKNTDKIFGFWTPKGTITKSDIQKAEFDFSGITFIASACQAGQGVFAKTVMEYTDCDYYISPMKSPTFAGAIYFSHIFYHHHFVFGKNVYESFERYENFYKNPFKWHLRHSSKG